MGLTYIDRYSLLHFAVGVVANFWGIDKYQLLLYHTIFELVENTEFGHQQLGAVLAGWEGVPGRLDQPFRGYHLCATRLVGCQLDPVAPPGLLRNGTQRQEHDLYVDVPPYSAR